MILKTDRGFALDPYEGISEPLKYDFGQLASKKNYQRHVNFGHEETPAETPSPPSGMIHKNYEENNKDRVGPKPAPIYVEGKNYTHPYLGEIRVSELRGGGDKSLYTCLGLVAVIAVCAFV
jgi:hypothetical protein